MTIRGQTSEEWFNSALAFALRKTNSRWSRDSDSVVAERRGIIYRAGASANLRPDIAILDPLSPPVIVECSYQEKDADKDAEARLECMVINGGAVVRTTVAVHIPEHYRKLALDPARRRLLEGDEFSYALLQSTATGHQLSARSTRTRRWPTRGYMVGTVYDLAALIPSAALPKESIEHVADRVALLVEEGASGLEIGLPASGRERIADLVFQRSELKGLRTTMVLWLNALLTQQRLHLQGVPDIAPVRFTRDQAVLGSKQVHHWRMVHDLNWRSIFGPAIRVLEIAGNSAPRATRRALEKLIEAVERIESSNLGLHINVGAELFPKLSEDRKQAAAYYTQPSTAELLANLTVVPSTLSKQEWSRPDLFRNHRLADLACGTGTLLRAGFRRIVALHERFGGPGGARLHRDAMENGIVGTDISPVAAHLTSSSMAALGDGKPYDETQIGWVSVGGPNAQTGSLEFFTRSRIASLFDVAAGKSTGTSDGNGDSVLVEDGSVDWVLMNPPYSRTRGGQSAFDIAGLSDQERKACQARWGKLTRQEPISRKAGKAASFLALARKKCRPGGRIGFVLPLTAAFSNEWSKTRRMIETDCEDIVAVVVAAGHALGDRALSADTKMEEMLLTASRRSSTRRKGRIRIGCVTLWEAPTRMGIAAEIAKAIRKAWERIGDSQATIAIRVGHEEVGRLFAFEASEQGQPWSLLGVAHPDLAGAAEALVQGRVSFDRVDAPLGVDMTTLDELFRVGPTHHLIGHLVDNDPIGAFEFAPVHGPLDTIGTDLSLWGTDGTRQKQLIVEPTHRGSGPKGVGSDAARQSMRQHRSTLLYQRNMRWTSQAILAATTRDPVMGGPNWTALGHPDKKVRKLFALWSNSTMGLIVHWTRGQRTQAGRSRTQIGAIGQIPCPRINHLPPRQLELAEAAFETLAGNHLLPACQAHIDPVRHRLDQAVADVFEFSPEVRKAVDRLRLLWCHEPSVHGNNRAALALLAK